MAKEDKFADEMLTDNELENVSVGSIDQTSEDSLFLYNHGLLDTWHDNAHTASNWFSDVEEVNSGWAKAGIISIADSIGDTRYFTDNRQISREEAYHIVRNNFMQINDGSSANISVKNVLAEEPAKT